MTRPLAFLLFCLCLLFSWQAGADTLHLGERSKGTQGHLERLDDPDGRLDAAGAMQSSDWKALPGSLNAGFTRSVIWLRLQVQAGPDSPERWMLTLNNALIDSAILYDYETDGAPQERRSGESINRKTWEVDYRTPSFALSLQPDQPRWLLLRLEARNAMSVSVRLMPAAEFGDRTRVEYLGSGLYFGIYLALIVFHSVFWRMTRAPESGWYLIYVSCCISIESLSYGLPQQIFGIPGSISDRLLGCGLAASLPLGFIFAQRQLRPRDMVNARRVLTVLSVVIGLASATAVLAGHYQTGAPLVQITSLLTIPLLIGMAVRMLFQGHASARVFLLIFGIYYAGVIVSFLRNLGIVPTSFATDNAAALGTLLHMLLMSMRIINHYRKLKDDKSRAESRLKHVLQDQNAHLERQIDARTLELRDEIRRRTELEGELRELLRQEQRIREEQRDFVAMVSHEFRTPLAIIATSAQQIARNLGSAPERNEQRCQNIRESTSRLLTLVDNYLNHDRMAETSTELRHTEQNLPELLARSTSDVPPGRTRIEYHSQRQTLSCDTGLTRIALRNLIANADRHAPADSVIRLDVRERADAGMLDIRVVNEGPEIPREQAPLLFQKYFRGSQAQQSPGAGLGLYLVKRIATLHGGEVKLESTGKDGPICFRLSLPMEPLGHGAA
ncbi:sensor histidine kinase [Pseudomonas solani]|uniref:sensor histidine kinase n=1 Tax=Pseudomonas solani TaxID=2731552 RepID=UPI0035BE1FC4